MKNQLSEAKLMSHPDGDWWTSTCSYQGTEIVVKSCKDKGMKAHCFNNGNVIFTQRFKFIQAEKLLRRMQRRVDMWKNGTWVPKKLR